MKILIPTVVKCIKGFDPVFESYRHLDFGVVGVEYYVQCIIPNGMYYVLRHKNLDMFANAGDANYMLNMDRFEVIETRELT
jgi:hypothetical protein